MKIRLDQELVRRQLVATRSQAESYIRLGKVAVNGRVITKPGHFVTTTSKIKLDEDEQFVSRAALKLKSVTDKLKLDFVNKTVLDVGSSTGGFTDFSLRRGARKVIAVDVGTDQLHPKLRADDRIELYEKTDIRDFRTENKPDIILIDVSFISLREILPYVAQYLADPNTQIVAMLKPQFETGARSKNAGVIKNDTERRKILRDFENWTKKLFIIVDKADSEVAGAKGNLERFYLLQKIKH
jgi:23S rRNA (cytidine1920-2'-O)/16S rRNA (cytidine1409-2'-O)-methyltransferase